MTWETATWLNGDPVHTVSDPKGMVEVSVWKNGDSGTFMIQVHGETGCIDETFEGDLDGAKERACSLAVSTLEQTIKDLVQVREEVKNGRD